MFGDGRKLVVVGDRVLVAPTLGEERTREGLILPSSAVEKNEVQYIDISPKQIVVRDRPFEANAIALGFEGRLRD